MSVQGEFSTPSIHRPDPKIQGRRFIVTDEHGKPLSDVFIIGIYPSPTFSEPYTDATSRALGLPIAVEPMRQAIFKEISTNIEKYELFQDISAPNIQVFSAYLSHITDKGFVEEKELRISNPPGHDIGDFEYKFGAFWLVFKPGLHPELIFEDWTKVQDGQWIEHKVTLRPWPEREATFRDRPYIVENIQLQKDVRKHWNGSNPGGKPLFGKDPFVAFQERLRSMQHKALQGGHKRDAAWLELALAVTTKRTPHGYDNSGGDRNIRTGAIYLALDRMIELAPDIPIFQAWRDLRQFMLHSPMGLDTRGIGSDDNSWIHRDSIWTNAGLDMFLQMMKKYEKEPLVALSIGGMITNGFWKSAPKLRERYFQYRCKLIAKVLCEYPTVLWFSGFDKAADVFGRRENYWYPLVMKDVLLKEMKTKP